jgi:DNA polymerase-3 subunit delta
MQCLGVPNRITIAVGSETVLVDRVKVNLTAAVTKEVPDITRILVDASHDEASANIAQACAPTLFGEDVLVVIEGIDALNDDGVESLKAVLADLPENVWLLLTHPGGVKRKPLIDAAVKAGGEKIECKELKRGQDTTSFLTKEVTRRKRKITSARSMKFIFVHISKGPRRLVGTRSRTRSGTKRPLKRLSCYGKVLWNQIRVGSG